MVIRVGKKLSTNMFLNEKLVDLYLELPKASLSFTCKKLDMNYSHAIKLINLWEDMGLVVLNKAGNIYNMYYTYKGKRLSETLTTNKIFFKRSNLQWRNGDE